MAFLGRESAADQQRADRIKAWVQARSPYALFALGFGVVAVFDFFTGLGVPLGIVAIVVGVLGLRDLRRRPELIGRRMCMTGITLGIVGVVLTIAWFLLLPVLAGDVEPRRDASPVIEAPAP
jgi:hypothetical protein